MFMKKQSNRWNVVRRCCAPFLIAYFIGFPVAPVLALPQGESVRAGRVQFREIGNTMVVVQQSGSAVVNYNSFNIANGETVRFIQPSSSAAILNRVTGGGRSYIDGNLLANGQVYLINQNGILFSSSARVNVGGLVASGLNMTDGDFFARRMNFSGGGGSVINQGSIRAGNVTLVGTDVENYGSISGGNVTVAAGNSVVIDRALGGEIRITIDGVEQPELSNINITLATPSGNAPVTNQSPMAEYITEEEAADRIAGEISIVPVVTNGIVRNEGLIRVNGDLNGTVTLRGVRVGQFGEVTADGILAGGGDVGVYANDLIIIGEDSHTSANAGLFGDGGDVRIIANGVMGLQKGAYIGVRGGELGGDGGFVDTSGHAGVDIQAFPDAFAPNGENGSWLIDPPNFFIDDDGDRRDCNFLGFDCDFPIEFNSSLNAIVPKGGTGYLDVDDLEDYYSDYKAMSISTHISGSGVGQIALEDSITLNGTGVLILDASGNLFINGNINPGSGADAVILLADDAVVINNPINTGGGYFLSASGRDSGGDNSTFIENSITTGGGFVTIISQRANIQQTAGTISAGSGHVFLSANETVFLESTINAGRVGVDGNYIQQSDGNIVSTGDVLYQSASSLYMGSNARITSTSGDIFLKASDNARVTGLTANNGTVEIAADSISDGGDAVADVAGAFAALFATNGSIGASNPIETQLGTVGGFASGGTIRLAETAAGGNITIGTIPAFVINAAQPITNVLITYDSGAEEVTFVGRQTAPIDFNVPAYGTGLIAQGNGYIEVTTANGDVIVDRPVVHAGSGSVRLSASGADGDITINDPVIANNGFVTLNAQDDVAQNDVVASAANGYLYVNAGDDITMNSSGLGFTGNGNIRYNAGDQITFHNIITSNGNISVVAGGNIQQNSNIITLVNGSIDVESTGGTITMNNGSIALVGPNRDIRYAASGNIFLSSLISTQGDVSVRSYAGSIRDGGDALPEIIAQNVRLEAAVGVGQLGGSANALEMAANTVAARAGSGGINLAIGGDVTVGTTGGGIAVNRVNSSGNVSSISDGSLSGYTTTGGGSIVQVGNGTATISSPVAANGAGNIALINSSSNSAENIVINNTISSGSGNITIVADHQLIQNSAGDITTTGGDIVGVALGSHITMANGAETRSSGAGDVLYLAATNVYVGSIDSGSGSAVVVAKNGQIIDNGDIHKDILGASAMLISLNGGVGRLNPIDTRVGTLAGYVENGPFRVIEDDNLVIGNVGPVTINLVGLDGLITTTNIPAIPGIIITNGTGNIEVSTVLGSITVNGPVVNFADGNIILTANGAGSDLIVNGVIVGADGNIRITAADSIFQTTNIFNLGTGYVIADAGGSIYMTNALTFANDGNILYNADQNATISSLVTSNGNISVLALQNIIQASNIVAFGGGTIDVDSSLGSITMIDGSLSYAPDGNIRYEAFSDVSLASLITTQGRVAVFSTFGDILDSGDALPEVIAPEAQFTALNGGIGTMGTNGNPIEVVLTNIAARAGSGGINVINVGNLVVGDVVAVPVNRVQLSDGSDAPIGGIQRTGLTTLDNGSISLVNLGNVEVNRIVSANGTGNVVIATATGTVGSTTFSVADLVLNTNVLSGSGNITLLSGSDIIQNFDGNVVTVGGDISAVALAGDIVQVDGVRSFTDGGDIAYVAGTNILVSSLQSGTGSVALISINGDVIDNGDIRQDVIGDGLFAVAVNGNVGSVSNRIDTDVNTLSGASLNGGMYILEDDDLEIAQVGPIGMNVVLPNNVNFQTNLPAFNGLVSSNGSLLVDTVLGDITVNGLVGSLSTNNLRLSANGGDSDLIVNDTVFTADGSLSLLAAGSININTTVVSAGSGTVDIEAFFGGITMSDQGLVVSAEEDIRMFARQDVVLGSVVATQSSVHIQSTLGSILDGGDSLPEIIAARAQLVATNGSIGTLGVGTDDSLETGIGTLAALASAGGINIVNGGDITVGTISDVVTERVNADDTLTQYNAGPLSGLVTTNDGSIVLIDRGSVTVDDRIAADGAGHVLLLTQTGEVASVLFGADVTVNDTITSGSGHITIIAGQDFQQNLGGDISTEGDIGVVTREGNLVQVDGVKATSATGNMVFVSSSNMLISAVHALTGSVTLTSVDGTIYDNGDTDIDLIANEVQLFSFNGGVGVNTNGIETTISRVAGLAANGTLKLTETDDLVIGRVEPIPVNVVNPDASLSVTSFPALAGLIVSNGNLLVDTIDGSITVDSAVLNGGNGNILLEANGEGSDIEINELVFAQNGNISVIASNDVRQNNSIISAGVGTVDVLAEDGSITMTGTNTVGFAGDGAVRYQARKDVTITSLISPSNTVSIIAEEGSILDGGDDLKNVLAPSLRMVAGTGAGTDSNDLETLIGFISARAGTGGVHVVNDGITVITTISNVVTERVLLDGSTTSIIDLAQSDLVTTNGGSISLETVNGPIIVFDGEQPDDGIGVSADGAGFINLSANGSNSYLFVDASIISDMGEICLKADDHIIINTNSTRIEIETGKRGAIALWADNDLDGAGDIYQLDGTVKTAFGNIYYYGENIYLLGRSRIQSIGGSISIKAGNNFLMSRTARITTQFGGIAMDANNNLTINGQIKGGTVALLARRGSIKGGGKVTADELSMRANKNIGTEKDFFDINAGVLAVETKRGDVYLTEEDSVVIGPVPGIYLRFGVPFCCEDMPVASARPLDEMNVAGRLEFNVGRNLSGNTINVGDDAIVDVEGSVNGLETLEAGGNILLTVGGDYVGNNIIAGGNLNATIGGDLEFDLISAGRVDIVARNIYMSRLIARNFANIRARGTIFDDDSLITAPDIIMIAGGDIGPNAPIEMNVGRIDVIQAGGNMDIVQLRQGDTFVNRLQAGGDMNVSLPNGGLVDRNGGSLNLISSSATINARYIGTLSDPMEVSIVPGNLKVDGAGLSGEDTPEGYVWIHLEGEIGKKGDRKIDYIGKQKIPGLIIYNNVILGGKDEILRRFKRGDAFLAQVPELTGPEGILGSDFYFLDMNQPGVGGMNIHLHYIVREMAEMSGLPKSKKVRAEAKEEKPAPAKAGNEGKAPVPLASAGF